MDKFKVDFYESSRKGRHCGRYDRKILISFLIFWEKIRVFEKKSDIERRNWKKSDFFSNKIGKNRNFYEKIRFFGNISAFMEKIRFFWGKIRFLFVKNPIFFCEKSDLRLHDRFFSKYL
jgi:hypothetical protein